MSICIAFNKPYGVLCQFTDPEGRPTLKDYIPIPDIYSIGRLDFDSEGLILLTDDGLLNHRLADPRFEHEKTYLVQVEGVLTEEAIKKLRAGVQVQGRITKPALVDQIPEPAIQPRTKPITPHGPTDWLRITLHEGKKRQIRHMTASVDLPTLRIVRIGIGPIELNSLLPGEWRFLGDDELSLLRRMVWSRVKR